MKKLQLFLATYIVLPMFTVFASLVIRAMTIQESYRNAEIRANNKENRQMFIKGYDAGTLFMYKQDQETLHYYMAGLCARLDKYESVQDTPCDSVPSSYYEELTNQPQ